MKPATKKLDSNIWKLHKAGILPKDIVVTLELHSLCVVYNALYRERRRRGIPLKHWLGPKKTKKDKKVVA